MLQIKTSDRFTATGRALSGAGAARWLSLGLWVVAALAWNAALLPASATIGLAYQMQLGNPSNAATNPANTNHYLIQRTVEAIDYNATLREPNWASWDLTAGDVGSSGRSSSFFTDTNLPPGFYEVTPTDYSGSGYDRGHMCPSDDRTDNTTDNDLVFYMSNIIPQASNNNQGVWADFETYCRSLASAGNELLITCGPSGFDGTRTQSSGTVAVPQYTWKIAVVVPLGSGTALDRITTATRVIALKIPNSNSVTANWQDYVTSANQIQNDTGFTFFTALPTNVAVVLRARVDGQTNLPVISGFSPASGAANTNVVITGTVLDAATAVAFNGMNAAFTVNSSTQITAIVPTNAATGAITVTTPSGTATSPASFVVITAGTSDLALVLTHAGSFFQGDPNDVYTLVVTNRGAAASAGTVSVVDTLPAGLVATALSGSGWTVSLAPWTCTRSDSLAAGAAYPAITLTVSVTTNAPATVTNLANVSGGGDAVPGNNGASDVTVINPAGGGAGAAYNGVLAGWDMSGQSAFGVSPLTPATNAPNLVVNGLARGTGVSTSGTAAGRAWGGVGFTDATATAAITANRYATFGLTAVAGYTISCTAIGRFDYRRSSTGPANGVLQYQVGAGGFVNAATLAYSVSTSGGASLGPIDLSGIAALQNVAPGTLISFRIVNWGGTSSGGTWYVFDLASDAAPDLTVVGTVTPLARLTPIQAWRQQWYGVTNNAGNAADTFVNTADGMPNLLKYALGLNPLVTSSNPIVAGLTNGHLRLATPRNANATDITMTVVASGDMVTWTTNGVSLSPNTTTSLAGDDGVPVGSGTNRFIRLRVSDP